MKKIMILFAAATFLVSCGNDSNNAGGGTGDNAGAASGTDNNAAGTTETPASGGGTASAEADKGLDLIAQSDCLTCHKVEEKLVGPAYREIAQKYDNSQATIDTLASKIINGGAGNWGQVPMTPHPTISKEDAQSMVQYIMSLK